MPWHVHCHSSTLADSSLMALHVLPIAFSMSSVLFCCVFVSRAIAFDWKWGHSRVAIWIGNKMINRRILEYPILRQSPKPKTYSTRTNCTIWSVFTQNNRWECQIIINKNKRLQMPNIVSHGQNHGYGDTGHPIWWPTWDFPSHLACSRPRGDIPDLYLRKRGPPEVAFGWRKRWLKHWIFGLPYWSPINYPYFQEKIERNRRNIYPQHPRVKIDMNKPSLATTT